MMRKLGSGARAGASVALSACVQTQQYADVQFTPPQGDYKLLVLRPDVTVGSLTTGGMVEPRADWTDQARASIVAALRGAAGRRAAARSRSSSTATRFRRHARRSSRMSSGSTPRSTSRSSLHKYLGDYLPTKRGKGLDWTLGAGRRAARPEDRLRLRACSSMPRTRSRRAGGSRSACLALAGCIVGFCAPNIGGATAARLCLARRPQDRRSGVVQRRPAPAARCRGSSSATCARRKARRRWSIGCSGG